MKAVILLRRLGGLHQPLELATLRPAVIDICRQTARRSLVSSDQISVPEELDAQTNAATEPAVSDAMRRTAIVHNLRYGGSDDEKSHAMYHEDAIFEFPQSGERFIGLQSCLERRKQYPVAVRLPNPADHRQR